MQKGMIRPRQGQSMSSQFSALNFVKLSLPLLKIETTTPELMNADC